MKKNLLRPLLLALMVLVGGSAWAGDKTVVKYSFDDAMSPSLTAGSRVSFDYDKTSVITSTTFLNAWNNANGDPGASTVSLGSTDLSGETWTLSFEWAACGGCNSKADHTTLKAGDTNLFDLTGNSNWNTTVTITYAGSDGTKTLPVPGCDKNKRFKAAVGDQLNTTDYWHHIVVTGSTSGVTMTITNSSTGTAVVENVMLSETNVNPTSLIIEPCCGGAIGIDELSLTYFVEGEVIQTPTANYTAVNGIERTITATCETEDATLYYSTDGENWTEGASVTVSESGNVYFKAVKGNSESDVLTFEAVAGEAITLNAPTIVRSDNTTVTISADQTNLLLSPTATIKYTYGNETGEFTGSKTLTVAADATITAYAEATGYTTSATSERAVALFPEYVNSGLNTPTKTSGTSSFALSTETITVSGREYAALLLDDVQWGTNVYLQNLTITDPIVWGIRNGNWYINTTDPQWILIRNLKANDIVVVDVTYPAADMVNATYSEKLSFGTKHAYIVNADGDVELDLRKTNAKEMNYFYGVYSYSPMSEEEIAAITAFQDAKAALEAAITDAKAIETEGKEGVEDLQTAIAAAEAALAAEDATTESLTAAKNALAEAVATFEEANKPAFDPATAIVNAGFNPEADPLGWEKANSASFADLGMGLISTYQVRGEHPAATVDETHLATEYAAGIECRWSTSYAAFTQTTAELPAGSYKLTYDVENTNATTTKANYENRFNVTVGENVYNDESTEWMNGKSAWTTHTIIFTLTEASPITISLGYGTGANNFGVGNTPALFVSHFKLEAIDAIGIALTKLKAAIDAAQAQTATYTIGEVLFTYAASEITPLTEAITTAQAAYNAAESVEAVEAATTTLNAFVAAFAPDMILPDADKAYIVANTTADGNLCIADNKVTVAKDAKIYFTKVDGGFVLSNENSEYILKTATDNWTLNTTTNKDEAYVVNFNLADGAYTIQGVKGLFGTDDTTEGSAVYANKTQANNGLWTVAEYVAPEPVSNDYTNYIVNADLKGEGGFDATGTKGIDGSGIVKAGSGAQFDFKQTIENLPAGQYKLTAQAAYRYSGSEADEAAAIDGGTETKLASLYATVGEKTVSEAVMNRYDGASETDYAAGNGSATVNEKFVPNSSAAVQAWFEAGQYVNEVIFNLPADGAVTIGIVKTAQPEAGDYTVIGPWTLTRLGDAEPEAEDPLLKEAADVLAARQSVKTKTALQAAYDAYAADATADNKTALEAAMEPAKVSVNSYKILEAGQLPDDKLDGWTCTNEQGIHINTWSVEGNSDGTGMQTPFIENWVWKGDNNDQYLGTGEIYYSLPGLDPGIYQFSALIRAYSEGGNAPTGASLFAGDREKEFATGKNFEYNNMKGIYDTYAMAAEVGEDGIFKFGIKIAEERNFNWMAFKSCKISYVGGVIDADAVAELAKTMPEGKMNAEVKTAAETAIATATETPNLDNYEAAAKAIAEASASVAAYQTANAILPKMKELVDATNVYTAEAQNEYYGQWIVKYNEGTLTTSEANALQDPFLVTGWRANITVDNFLLSAWDTNPDFQNAPYYINSWSVEGENDGSEFKVPFFEYWTGDGDSLGEKTLTATMNNLEAGEYDVTAWVRVRAKNGYTAPAYGITFQANDGENVNAADGTQVGESQFYLKEVSATGTVAEDGVLKIKFNVAADNNISWLSFKNVKFEKKAPVIEPIEGISYSWESPAGEPIQWGGTIAYVNGDGNRLNYKNGDYWTICLNGKKANINDETPSANAGHMEVTLDQPLNEGDVIEITAYVNKNESKKSSAYILFGNGAEVESEAYSDEANIDPTFNGVPTTKSITVTAEMAGAQSFKMTRGQTGTNLFITKLQVIEKKGEEPKAQKYEGYVAIATTVQGAVQGAVSTEAQTVTITETAEENVVAITFSGFSATVPPTTFPEITFNANITGEEALTYTVAEGSKVTWVDGMMRTYNVTGTGTQASAEATPVISLQFFQNPMMLINVVFAATENEAKTALETITSISNLKANAGKESIYTLSGQKVEKAQKGLYIINGKKVVVK